MLTTDNDFSLAAEYCALKVSGECCVNFLGERAESKWERRHHWPMNSVPPSSVGNAPFRFNGQKVRCIAGECAIIQYGLMGF